MQVSIEARRLNKEQFPLNLLLYSNISLCLCPRYCTSMEGINWLAYRPRAHSGVLPCKHFCLPTSAMLHYSCRAVTRVLFLENMEKEQHPSLPLPCTRRPLDILSGVTTQGWRSAPVAGADGAYQGARSQQDREVRVSRREIPLECRPRMPAHMRYYSKLELIRPQLHSESCIPFLHVLKYDRSLSRVRK